jgi:Macrocin-O-methyltransferase (TylF)
MPTIEKLARFARKPLRNQWAAIRATFSVSAQAAERRRLYGLLTGAHAPPRVLGSDEKTYIAYRPDSDVNYKHHSEVATLSEKWIKHNLTTNAGDLPRLYALILNIKQVLADNIIGEIAELGVYRGNSAALLAHYARIYHRTVLLFDTFEGFDQRDLVGVDGFKLNEFGDTSLDQVRELVGDKNVRFIQGRFPESIPPELHTSRLCLAHIDCDLYEPAKAGLEFFYPRLSPGGILIIHDYANPYWGGIKRAVDEYCCTIPERPLIFGDKSGTAMIRKSVNARLHP